MRTTLSGIDPRLLLVEVDGRLLIVHRLSCTCGDEPELDEFAANTLVPRLSNLVTRGGSVTSAAFLAPTSAVPGRFKMLEVQPDLEIDHTVEAYDIVRRFET